MDWSNDKPEGENGFVQGEVDIGGAVSYGSSLEAISGNKTSVVSEKTKVRRAQNR